MRIMTIPDFKAHSEPLFKDNQLQCTNPSYRVKGRVKIDWLPGLGRRKKKREKKGTKNFFDDKIGLRLRGAKTFFREKRGRKLFFRKK